MKKSKIAIGFAVVLAVIAVGALGVKIYFDFCYPKLLQSPKEIAVHIDEPSNILSIDDIYKSSNGTAEIDYNGKFTENKITNEQEVLSALLELRNLLNISEYSYFTYRVDESSYDYNEFSLQQLHNGIPVDFGGFRVTATKDGEAVKISGKFVDVEGVATEPKLSYRECAKSLELESGTYAKTAQLVIYAIDGDPVLCWKYETKSPNLLDDECIYVDASNGNIVLSYGLCYY